MSNQLLVFVALAVIFAAVILAVLAVAPMFATKNSIAHRLSGLSSQAAAGPNQGPRLRNDDAGSLWAQLVTAIEKRGLSLADTKGDALVEKLMLAGFTQTYAPRVFVLARTVLTIALPAFALAVMLLADAWPTPAKLYLIVVGLAVVGLFIPNIIVSSRAAERKKEILNGFPDTLDLMLVCVEAGLGIDQTFSRVGSEITTSHPLLAELLANVSLELRAGKSREFALRNLTRRSGVNEIGSFVTLLIQSNKLGSSIATALKIYAGEMREARKMRAEEKAHRLPVLLSIPIVVFLLPIILAVFMLPVAINMREQMKGVFGGHPEANAKASASAH